jgi:hypothetical protein
MDPATKHTYEIDSNRGNVGFRVGIIGKSQQQTGFTDTRITNQ